MNVEALDLMAAEHAGADPLALVEIAGGGCAIGAGPAPGSLAEDVLDG